MKSSKTLLALLVTAGFSSIASAHDYGGTLGTTATAKDKFYLTCVTATAKMTYQIRRNSGTASVKLSNDATGISTTSTATGTFSPLITVTPTTGGAKFFTVTKSAAGAASYTARIHCYDASGVHQDTYQSATVTYTLNQ